MRDYLAWVAVRAAVRTILAADAAVNAVTRFLLRRMS